MLLEVRKKNESRVTSSFSLGKVSDFCGRIHRERYWRNRDLAVRFQFRLL